ncbi:metal ABC transporter ATP-binding protein [Aureimonas sp. N4]|uniref:metal ABC transporter ATP-binding protein n=1 Tax=Aureimonas sp. N4 TaxID=1638165 RepID=UPI000784572D|nr:ABC transporter ATP-binding protein [Aureimonas sp. N4]
MSASVSLNDLTLAYHRQPAVRHVSGRFAAGSLTAIVGPNGAGKSTLLKGLMGLVPVSDGQIRLDDISRHDIAYLPQSAEIDRSFPIDVLDLVSLGAWRKAGFFGRITGAHLASVADAIRAVGLEGFEKRVIGSLSGGQLQRALFARMLVQDARLLLLDEPFTAIDARTTADLLRIVRNWNAEGRTIIAVLHDIELVREHFPQTLLIARDLVAWGHTSDVLTKERLREARNLSENWVDPFESVAA